MSKEPRIESSTEDYRVGEIQAGMVKFLDSNPTTRPKSLYHYTSAASFLNIVRSKELWFTDIRYLNDSSELNYGVQLFQTELKARQKVAVGDEIKLLTMIHDEFDRIQFWLDGFAFSLCEKDDLLNQWRVYGQGITPVAIEFATDVLQETHWQNYRTEFFPLIYDKAIQHQIVNFAIDLILEKAKLKGYSLRLEEMVADCADCCLRMKHPEFLVEHEWRMLVRFGLEHRSYAGLGHRATSYGIVPFLSMTPEGESRLPIAGVTVGPCSNPELQKKSIASFLYSQYAHWYEIRASNLPLRQ